MDPDNNGMKNTLFRSLLLVTYTTSSHRNKGPLYGLVISAHCRVTHVCSIRRTCSDCHQRYEHYYMSVAESSNPQTLSCGGKKENLPPASVHIVWDNSLHHVQRQPLHAEWPEPCSTSSTRYVTMLFGGQSVGLHFELNRFELYRYACTHIPDTDTHTHTHASSSSSIP